MEPTTNYFEDQFCNIRREIAKTESDLKSSIHAVTDDTSANFRAVENTLSRNQSEIAKGFSDTTFRLHDNIRTVTDTILTSTALTNSKVAEAKYELALSGEKNTAAVLLAGEKNAAAIALAGQQNTAAILAALAGQELRSVQDELNEKRIECSFQKSEINFGSRFSMIQSQINDLSQNQHATNQAINFGSGSTGKQTNTSNQVK